MNLEDKKFLAEWMGRSDPGYFTNGMEKIEHVWDPDTAHEQFKEVWNKLTKDEHTRIMHKTLIGNSKDYFSTVLLNNLSKVCQAVIEVIKEKNEQTT